MKVLIFSSKFFPFLGGLENFVFEIGKRLVKLNVKVGVVTLNYGKLAAIEEIEGITVYRLPCLSVLGGVYDIPLKVSLKGLDYSEWDVFVTNTRFFVLSFAGKVLAKAFGKKLVHVEHGTGWVKHSSKMVEWFVRLYDLSLGIIVVRGADLVVGICNKSVEFAKKLQAGKTDVVFNSVDPEFFVPVDNKRDGNGMQIVCVSRLIKAKGLHDLIKAVNGLDVELSIIGDGPYREELEKLAGDNVFFHGSKDREFVAEYVAASDLLVMPSYSEGLPTVVLEALSCNVPVVISDVGGLRDVIKEGVNGMFFIPGDMDDLRARIKMALSKTDWTSMRELVEEKFSWDVNALKFKEVLEEVLEYEKK